MSGVLIDFVILLSGTLPTRNRHAKKDQTPEVSSYLQSKSLLAKQSAPSPENRGGRERGSDSEENQIRRTSEGGVLCLGGDTAEYAYLRCELMRRFNPIGRSGRYAIERLGSS